MKKNLQKIVLALAMPVLYVLFATGFNSISEKSFVKASGAIVTDAKDFLNIIFNLKYEGVPEQNWVERNLNMYGDSLNYNAIQIYDEGSLRFGTFDVPLTGTQISNVQQLMTDIGNKDLKGIYARTKIFRLAEGQRLEYEVSSGGSTTVNDGFCYQNVMNNTYTTDSGRTVLHAKTIPSSNPNSPGSLCSGIYENMQHSDFINGKDRGVWFIKPMMRIRQSDFSPTDTTSVVRIDVINFNNNLIKSVTLRVRNFSNSSFNYDGSYINIYNFQNDPGINLEIFGDTITTGLNHGRIADYLESSKVDFKVYWFGQVDVWFDKMTVDDELGDGLFGGDFDDEIFDEVTHFTDEPSNYSFYCDEAVYSQIPCLEYIKNKMLEYNPDSKLSIVMSNSQNRYSLRNDAVAYDSALSRVKPKIFFTDPYLIPWEIPNNLNFTGANRIIPSAYNDTIQRIFGSKNSVLNQYDDSFIRQINITRNKVTENSPESKFFVIPQLFGHMVKSNSTGNFVKSGNREPTNEELQAQAMISISHGAEGLGWYVYQNTDWQGNSLSINQAGGHHFLNSNVSVLPYDYTHYNFGLFNVDSTKRSSNVTGQNKWDYVSKMNKTILNWKPTLDKITWTSGYSVHSETATHEFIYDIKSLKRDPYHEYIEDSPCTFCDAPNERYWEMGFFGPDFDYPTVSSTDKSKYFLMVNRRCVPDTPTSGQGDFRSLRIKFDSTQLSGFTNWKITELDTNNVITTFNKNTASFINMGEFKPGEGKLYKLAPVMQEGGTLVADESVSGSFDCKGLVNNGGKNITLIPGTTINFANSDARIVMNGGNFKSGINTGDNTAPVNLQGKEDTLWKGLVFQDCPSVEMYKTYFKNISPYEMDSTYAIDLVNCLYSKIDGCSFLADEDLNTGGIRANFTFIGEYPVDAYFLNSTFQMSNENIPALSFISSGGITVPLIIDGNTFTSDEGNSANAIFLCNVSGGAIKNNTITDYKTGVFMLSSAMDFYNNVIDGSSDNSIGIKSASQSALGLGSSGNYYTAGLNSVTSDGNDAMCIYVDKSSFDLHKGENTFDLKNYSTGQSNSYHLSGHFPDYHPNTTVSAVQNCFRLSGSNTNELQNVNWVTGDPINFDFLDYSCEISEPEEKLLVDLGNGNTDTIYFMSGGSGGGIGNYELGIKNYVLKNGGENVEIVSMESLIDSININTRKRNYNKVITNCQDYLSNHLNDSSNTGDQSSGIISKLFLASSRLDVSGNKITELKTLLENLILNNSENESLIKSAFYYIQKCKVKLGEYESAMTGFQQIMDQNPYTYEALTASWDFSATYLLLLNQSGSGGGISNFKCQMMN